MKRFINYFNNERLENHLSGPAKVRLWRLEQKTAISARTYKPGY